MLSCEAAGNLENQACFGLKPCLEATESEGSLRILAGDLFGLVLGGVWEDSADPNAAGFRGVSTAECTAASSIGPITDQSLPCCVRPQNLDLNNLTNIPSTCILQFACNPSCMCEAEENRCRTTAECIRCMGCKRMDCRATMLADGKAGASPTGSAIVSGLACPEGAWGDSPANHFVLLVQRDTHPQATSKVSSTKQMH